MAVTLSGFTLHTSNDNQTWTGTDGADAYNNAIQGANSESWVVGKNATETATLGVSSSLPTSRGLFLFWMSTNLSNYYTDIKLQLQSTTNNYKEFTVATSANKKISGVFVSTAVDYVNKGASVGSFNPASLNTTTIIYNNSSSGNIRSTTNTWIDAMWYGTSHSILGSTTSDKLFTDVATQDFNSKIGGVENFNDEIFSQVDLKLDGTSLISDSETLVFVDATNGYSVYLLSGIGTASMTNSFIKSSGAIAYDFNMASMASFSMIGGGLLGYLSATFAVGQTLDSVLFQDGGTTFIPNTSSGLVFNKCGQITLQSTLTNGIVNAPPVLANQGSILTDDLANIDNVTFTRASNGHAVELSSIGTGTMSWNSKLTGYASVDGSAGNEAIFVNVGSGNLTVNVASGSDAPSIRSAGATVTVVSGATLTISSNVTGCDVVVLEAGTNTILADVDAQAGTDFDYAYSINQNVDIGVIKQGYVIRYIYGYSLTGINAILPVTLFVDRNYE